jgi:hypothetical protein
MTDSTDPAAAKTESEPVTFAPERLGSKVSGHAASLFGSAMVLSTTALLPLIDPKNPPFRGD